MYRDTESESIVVRCSSETAPPARARTLNEKLRVADAIRLNGTPSYVIGTEVMTGAPGFAALKEKIDAARH